MIRPLYKAQEPFMEVKSGHGYMGVVMYDDAEDKVQCHLCGAWFSSLGSHIVSTHKVSTDNYKMDHGLSLRTALCSRSVSAAHSKSGRQLYASKKSKLSRGFSGKRRRLPKAPKQYYTQTIQAQNARGLCALQIRGRYDVIKKIVGREPTFGDYQKHDRKLYGAMCARYGTINKFRKHMGGVQMNNSEWRMLPNTVLIAALRKTASMLGRMPKTQDFQRHNINTATFYRHFGSWANALRMAGLK